MEARTVYGLLGAHLTRDIQTKGLFGRAPAPAPAPRAAPGGALPNGIFCNGSRCGAAPGAPRGFRRGGGAMAPPDSALLSPLLPSGGARSCRSGRQQEGGGGGGAEAEGKREERGREEGGGNTWDLPLLRRFAPPSIDLRHRSHRSRAGVHRFAPPESEPVERGRGAARGISGRGRRATRGTDGWGHRATRGTDGRGCRGRPRPAAAGVRRCGAEPEERRARRRGWNR
jgi:hypothetical protein